MTKHELVKHLAVENNLKQSEVEQLLAHQAQVFIDSLSASGEFTLPGVGKFSVKEHAERQGRNPQTGEALTIPAKKAVAFKAASDVRKTVNA